MKLAFFLIAFFLIFLRVYFAGPWHLTSGKNDVTISVSNGDDHEQIRYSGKIMLTDDLSGIKSISPGGFIKYEKNDRELVVESSVQGNISYKISGESISVRPGDRPDAFITEAITEMIAFGFQASEIMKRIYAEGGDSALFNELGKLRSPGVINMYLDHLLEDDSAGRYTIPIIKKIGTLGSDHDKTGYLNKLAGTKLKDPQTAITYLGIVGQLGSDMDKINALNPWTGADTIEQDVFRKILEITAHLGSDNDKLGLLRHFTIAVSKDLSSVTPYFDIVERLGSDADKINMLNLWTGRDSLPNAICDRVLDIGVRLGSDMDKENLFRRLIQIKSITENNWLTIIDATAKMGSDLQKGDLLFSIAQKMPADENVKAACLRVAKTIGDVPTYEKLIRAIE